ncbi:hypothetical protein C4J81_18780 (plasmid) [Deltaproteobacteria bacterium Smac51]|nr:hypothetical protein C4J81_18780 [Deltaproteobacteria bacterium Smac51]
MEKIAAINYMASGRFAEPILRGLGDEAVFYCGPVKDDRQRATVEAFKKSGVEVVINNYDKALKHKFFLMDSAHKLNINSPVRPEIPGLIRKLEGEGARFIHYTHNSGFAIPNVLFGPQDYILCPSEAFLASTVGGGKFIFDGNGQPIMGKTPQGSEAVVTGLGAADFSVEQDFDKKAELNNAAEQLGLKLNPDLPTILYLVDFRFEKGEMETACQALAQKANVIIKNQGPAIPEEGLTALDIEGENIFYFAERRDTNNAFYRLRQAVDCTVVSFISGGFVTNVMLGLRTIPVYSTTVVRDMPPHRYNYTYFLRDFGGLNIQLNYWFAPLPLAAPELLARRLDDEVYWQRYDREIETVQRFTFGEYFLGREAVERAVFFIRRLLRVRSFAPSVLPEGGGMKNGPIYRPPCPVAL